ncbi:MAG: Ppx/GppA phosphatase family protein [Mycobacteriaceae bacterium]|uniref:Ppx/GppA phosphatase family protein n=1 Tax=Corynebacterium sp. TaxID=1720 RepID=UPI003F9642BF
MATGTFASIDCGTNSIRLLITEVADDGTLREINRDNIIVRLGQGVDATGRFAGAALDRVDEALGTYADRMVFHGVTDVMMGATSATRDAANREDFFAITRRHLGRIAPGTQAEVVSGIREAELSFAGAVADLGQVGPDERICVIDLGGGSTEFVVNSAEDGGIGEAYSADMGCVRLTERYLHSDPPVDAEIADARAYVDGLMGVVGEHVDLGAVTRVVGVAGTVTTVGAIHLGLGEYAPEATHMSELDLEGFRESALALLGQTVEQRRSYPAMHPGRADVIGGGAIVIDAFASRFLEQGLSTITVSEKDILDGMLAEVIARNA